MASLKSTSSRTDPDPNIAFKLELVGPLTSNGVLMEDWLESRLSIGIFGQQLERPGKNPVSYDEIAAFIDWLKRLSAAKEAFPPFQTVHEPLFRISAEPVDGRLFEVTALMSAYGTARGFSVESAGVSVTFRSDESSILTFSRELELELRNGKSRQSSP